MEYTSPFQDKKNATEIEGVKKIFSQDLRPQINRYWFKAGNCPFILKEGMYTQLYSKMKMNLIFLKLVLVKNTQI
jgi:hypothetical protein